MSDFKKTYSISLKIFIIVFFSIITIIGTLYVVSETIIAESYLNVENIEVLHRLDQIESITKNEVSQLVIKLKDWAYWDDTYKFAQDKNKAYIDSNLGTSSLSNLKINLIAIYNVKGELVFEKTINLNSSKQVDLGNTKNLFTLNKKLITHDSVDSIVMGIVISPEGPLLLSSVPILTSDMMGPIKGSIIFGRFLDGDMVKSLETLTLLSFKFYEFNSRSLPEDVSNAKLEIFKGVDGSFANTASPNNVFGYRILNDISGNPALMLKVDVPRVIYNEGQKAIRYFILISSLSLLFLGAILVLLIKKIIINRLLMLSKEVENIYKTDNLSLKVKDVGKDEIGMLANIINNAFGYVLSSRNTEEEVKHKLEIIATELKNKADETERVNKLMIGRELQMMELKKEIIDLKNNKQ